MLDHLSGGRFQLGVGRGISPIENDFYGVEVPKSQAIYLEAYAVIMQALTAPVLDHAGEFFRFRQVPMQLRPLQQPHPPVWYGLSNPEGAPWAAKNRVNTVSLAPAKMVRASTDRYRADWAALGRDPASMPRVGLGRHIVIADSDAEALAIARRAYTLWHGSFHYLWNHHNRTGVRPTYGLYPESFDELCARGQMLAGTAATVRAQLAAEIDTAGVNYMLLDIAWGDLSEAEVLRSLDRFARDVMPGFA